MSLRLVWVVLIVLMVLASVAAPLLRNRLYKRYEQRFVACDFDGCLKLLSSPAAAFAFPKFNLFYLRLNAYEAKGDTEATEELIEKMLRQRCGAAQRLTILGRAFSFYAGQGKRNEAEHVLGLIESAGDESLLAQSRQTFEIVFEKSSAYIDEMEARLPQASAKEQANLGYLLSLQYENKGDTARAQECLDRVARSLGIDAQDQDKTAPPSS